MSEQQTSGTGKEGSEAATVKEALGVRGSILDLAEEESRLELQRLQLQQQIAGYQRQIEQGSGDHPTEVVRERIAALQQELASLQDHLARLRVQKSELIRRQDRLLDKIDALRAEQQRAASKTPSTGGWPQQSSWTVERAPQRSTRRLIISLCTLAIVLAVSLLLARALYAPGDTDLPVNNNGGSTTLLPTFQPNGRGPTDEDCQTRTDDTCLSPEDLQQALNITPFYQFGYDGRGQTIVLLGAGYTTTLQDDLHRFDQTWGLPDPPSFQILQPHGPPTPYLCGDGSVDRLQVGNTVAVEWAHAIAPGANLILLIGSNGARSAAPPQNCVYSSMKDDLAYALNNHLGQIISLHDTYSELGQLTDTPDQKTAEQQFYSDTHALFQQAAQEQVTIVAATGDTGATTSSDLTQPNSYWQQASVSWPASDPYVLAVGGTSLSLNAAGTYSGESIWDNKFEGASSGGLSALYSEPGYQQHVPNQMLFQGRRGVPDVSFPARGFLIYGTFQTGLLGKISSGAWDHWDIQNSTGASAACWAGLIALANEVGGSPLGFIQPALYRLQGQDQHDIVVGNNTFAGIKGYEAQTGYDLVSGWGTPDAQDFLIALIQASDPAAPIGCHSSTHLCS
jgi:subtilase family serine protease